MNLRKYASSPIAWLIIISSAAFLLRLLTILFYQPISYGDTPSYQRLAETVLHGFTGYDGTRTPGYPVFLALAGSDQHVWLTQLLLGFFTTLLIFFMGWKLTDKPWLGGLLALAHTLNLGQLFFESNLLTESLTTFLMTLAMAGVLVWLLYPKYHRPWLGFLLGLSTTATLLVRPLFIYLPFYLLLLLWIETRLTSSQASNPGVKDTVGVNQPVRRVSHMGIGLAFMLPVVLLLGGWVTFIHKNFGEWAITTMTGYNLIQHTGNYFEYVPDEYASLRDTYIKYRDAQIAEFGTQTNAIWDAIPEMSKVSGYSFYALSRVLARISVDLILHHPMLYVKNAISGWWMFWRVPVYWSANAVHYPWLVGGVSFLVLLERGLLFLCNLVFIFSSIAFALIECLFALRRKPTPLHIPHAHPPVYAFLWMLLGNIWIASILQTLIDHGDNPRFLVPLQSMVVLWVTVFIYHIMTKNRAISPRSTSPDLAQSIHQP